MMGAVRIRTMALVGAAALVAACSSDGKTTATTTTTASSSGATASTALGAAVTTPVSAVPGCLVAPDRMPEATWLPSDFPMPTGAYLARELSAPQTAKVAVFVVPMTITQYVTYALAEFPKAGYRLGRGDSEAGEAEDSFAKGASAGAFRIRQPYCDTTKSELQISYLPDVAAARQATSTTATTATTTTP